MRAAEKINGFSGGAKTNWLRTIEKMVHLVNPTDNRAKFVTYPLIAAALMLLPQLPQALFMVCNCGGDSKKNKTTTIDRGITMLYAGQTTETLAYTQREYEAGRMTREEKLNFDNQAIQANSLASLNGIQTKADEVPGEWDNYKG